MSTLRLLPRTILRPLRSPPSPPALTRLSSSSSFQPGPSPPRLPADQQAEFERLQRAVSERIADPTPLPHEQPSVSPASTSRHTSSSSSSIPASGAAATAAASNTSQAAQVELPTSVRRGAKPEFEGDTNPKTGEVGGPKNEPLRWGSGGDWSYNGRVTDF